MRRYFFIALAVVLLFIGRISWDWYQFISTPMATQPIHFIIKPGTTIFQLQQQLVSQGFLHSPRYFHWLVRYKNAVNKIKYGEYLIDAKTTPEVFLDRVVRGEVVMHRITLVGGWTFKQDMQLINSDPALKHTLKGLSNKQIMAKLGHPNQHPEGRFFPDTYFFARGTTDTKILKLSYNDMQKRLTKLWQNRVRTLPYKSVYSALIVASMIQKETFVEHERPQIAGVILRRLKKGMRLQIDPTVIYGLGSRYKGRLTRRDMRFKSPYNTYLNKGLPPTPICMPNAHSLYAAFHPAKGDALFYVLSTKGDGSHVFSKTYQKHKSAVTQYWRNQNKLKKQDQKDAKLLKSELPVYQSLQQFVVTHMKKLQLTPPRVANLISTMAQFPRGLINISLRPLLLHPHSILKIRHRQESLYEHHV